MQPFANWKEWKKKTSLQTVLGVNETTKQHISEI